MYQRMIAMLQRNKKSHTALGHAGEAQSMLRVGCCVVYHACVVTRNCATCLYYGYTPLAIKSRRSSIRVIILNRSRCAVARPLAVSGSIRGPFSRKCRRHCWVRGLKSNTLRPVNGSIEAMSLPLWRLQKAHAHARFSSVVCPPCLMAMI